MSDHQYPNPIVEFAEKEIIGEPSEIHSLVTTETIADMPGMFGRFKNGIPELGIKFFSESNACYTLIISHDRVDFGKDARVKFDGHLGWRSDIF